jgi:glutaredoxin/glutathione-dependent peroxiredoxin
MTIKVGDQLPEATFMEFGPEGVEQVTLSSLTSGRNVVIFALPGAFTRTCDALHVPSFIRTRQAFADKGVQEIICLSVNDPFVMAAWADSTGAKAAGLRMLADADGAYARAIGMEMNAPVVGLLGRSQRYAMHVVDGTIKVLQLEVERGVCDMTSGEALLEAI